MSAFDCTRFRDVASSIDGDSSMSSRDTGISTYKWARAKCPPVMAQWRPLGAFCSHQHPQTIVSSGSGRGFRDMNRNKNTTTDVGKMQIRAGFALGIRHGVLGDLSGTAIVGRDNSHGVDMRLRTAPRRLFFFGTWPSGPTSRSRHLPKKVPTTPQMPLLWVAITLGGG